MQSILETAEIALLELKGPVELFYLKRVSYYSLSNKAVYFIRFIELQYLGNSFQFLFDRLESGETHEFCNLSCRVCCSSGAF